jgi:xanthine dehydrogenase YagR molybdenum-binding subunit
MSVMLKAMTIAARYAPDRDPDPLRDSRGYLGRPLNRVDGPLKVSGAARFTAEFAPEGMAHAVLVCSRIANGRIAAIDTRGAETAPGVIAVMTHHNAPRLKTPSIFDVEGGSSCSPSDLPIMQNDRVRWNGEPVAVVVAETLEQAQYAAS